MIEIRPANAPVSSKKAKAPTESRPLGASGIEIRPKSESPYYAEQRSIADLTPPAPPVAPTPEMGLGDVAMEGVKGLARGTLGLAQSIGGAGVEMAGQLGAGTYDALRSPQPFPGMTPEQWSEIQAGRAAQVPTENPVEGQGQFAKQVFPADSPVIAPDPRASAENAPYLTTSPGIPQLARLAGEAGEMAPNAAATIGAAVATGGLGPAGALAGGAMGGGLEGLSEYQQVLDKGGSPVEALRAAAVMGAGAGALNAIPFVTYSTKFLPPSMRGTAARAMLSFIAEGSTETAEGGVSAIARMKSLPKSQEEWAEAYSKVERGIIDESNVFLVAGLMGGGTAIAAGGEPTIPNAGPGGVAISPDTAGPVNKLEPGRNAPLPEPERFEEDYAPFDLPAQEQAPTAPSTAQQPEAIPEPIQAPDNAVAPSPEAVVAPEPESELSESEKQAEADLLAEFPELKGMLDAARRSGPLNDDLVNTILNADTVDSREIPKIEVRKPVSKEESLSKLIEERPALDVGRPLDAAVRPEEEGVPQGPARVTVRAQDRPRPGERPTSAVPSPEVRATVRGLEPTSTPAQLSVGSPPKQGLAVANIGADGTLYIGEPGEIHYNLSEKYGNAIRDKMALPAGAETFSSKGFVGPDGKFMTREEALAWVQRDAKEKENKFSPLVDTELDAIDYREYESYNEARRNWDKASLRQEEEKSAPPTPEAEFLDWQERPRGQAPIALYNIPTPDGGKTTVTAETAKSQGFNVPEPTSLPTAPPKEPVQAQSPVRATEIAPEPEVAQKQPWEMTREEYDADKPPLKPRESIVLDNYGKKTEVVQNPTNEDVARLSDAVRKKFPDMPKGEVKLRQTRDEDGNEYIWQAHEGMHADIEPALQEIVGATLNQNADKKPHRNVVYDALLNGKTIPEEVLSQYPEVVDAYNASKKKNTPEPRGEMSEKDKNKRLESITNLKGVEERSPGLFYVPEKLMVPARRKGLGRGTSDFELKAWADVTGNPSDRGWAVVDRRATNASRAATQPAPEAKPEAPKAAAPPRASKAAQKLAKDRVDKHGLTKDQMGFLTNEIREKWDTLPRDSKGKIDPLDRAVIKVPGDGTFIIESQLAANAIHKRLTGKWIDEDRIKETKELGRYSPQPPGSAVPSRPIYEPVDPRTSPDFLDETYKMGSKRAKEAKEGEDKALEMLNAAKTPEERQAAIAEYKRAMRIKEPEAKKEAPEPEEAPKPKSTVPQAKAILEKHGRIMPDSNRTDLDALQESTEQLLEKRLADGPGQYENEATHQRAIDTSRAILQDIAEAKTKMEETASASEETAKGNKFYWYGKEAQYTGKTTESNGAVFYEFEYLEGADKGKKGVRLAPDDPSASRSESNKPTGRPTPQVPPPTPDALPPAVQKADARLPKPKGKKETTTKEFLDDLAEQFPAEKATRQGPPKTLEDAVARALSLADLWESRARGDASSGTQVGSGNIEMQWRADAVRGLVRRVNNGMSPQEATEEAKQEARGWVRKHNERRPKDINWKRDEASTDAVIDNAARMYSEFPKTSNRKTTDESGYVNMALFNPMEALRILRGKLKDGKFIEFEQGFMGLKDLKVARSGKIKSLQMRGKLIAQDFENAWRKEWQKQNPGVKAKTVRFRDMPAETVEALNDYLVEEDAGVKARLLSELPEGLRRPATQMRDLVDQMSQELIDMGIVEDDVQKVIADQMGFYLRRTYAIFQDPKYRDNIPKAVEDNARQWLREKFPRYTTNQIESALADLKGVGSEKEALNRLVQMGGVLGKLDRRTLGKRNEYDQAILDLWGVDKNGIDNFLNTVNAQAHMIANFEWLEDIKANGRGSVVLTPQDIAALPQGDEKAQWPFLNESDSRKAVSMLTRPKDPAASRSKALDKFIAKAESQGDAGTVEVLKKTKALFENGMKLEDGKEVVDSRNLEGASKYAEQLQAEADKLQAEGVAAPRGKKGPLKAKSRVAQSKANKVNRQIKAILEAEEQNGNTEPDTFGPFGPLAGARVHPEFKAALQEAVQIQEVAPWIQKWNWFNRQLKQNVTTRDPASALRNFRSGVDFSMANGWMLYDAKNVPKRLAKALSIANVDIRRSHDPALREEYLKMVEYGIAGDTAIVGELNEIQKEAKKAEFVKAAEKALSPELVKAMGGADALATKLYQAGDDVFKIFGALTEQEHLMEATGMDADAALKEAATRVRRQFPTYSEVHKSLQKLRRTPVIGPFVAYQSEVPRNAWNTIAQMSTEIKSDNPKVRAMGYRRAAGIMWATANRHAYKAAWLALLGLTPDDDDRIRKALPEYFQGHEFAITEGDKATGKYRGYNLSQADAYGPLKEPFWAALRGENIVDAAAKATEAFGGGYVSPELGTQAIVSVLTGTDARGKDLFLETDTTTEKLGKTLGYVLGQYAIPSPIRRQFKAKSEEEHALEVFGTLTGYRFIDIDLPESLFWKAKDFKKYGTEQVRDAYTAARDGDTEAARKQLKDLEAVRKEYFDDLQEAYIAFRDTGLNQETMDAKLKEAGLSGKEIEAVKYGTLEPYTPPQKLTDMME